MHHGSQTNKYDFNSFVNVKNESRMASRIGCSRYVDQRRRTICHQMKSACAVRGASHCQLISLLDVGQRWDDKTLPGTPERGH